jgi:predicted Rossmann fold flavoprotein
MTDYGISGIPVFQISGRAARILDRGEALYARIDFLPEFTQEQFEKETASRLLENRDQMLSDLLLGLAHRKVIDFLLASEGLQAEMKARRLSDEELAGLIRKLRAFDLRITNVRSFENAQVTCGGVPLSEVSDGFESVCCPGLYLAGELLDVDGRCGGYNLQWAMSSGYQAGSAAAQYSQRKMF